MVRGTRRSAVAAMAAVAMVGLGALPASASSHKKSPGVSAPKKVQRGHLKFWECASATTQVLVVVNTLTLHPGEGLTISFIVRNEGATACNIVALYAGVAPGPTASTLEVGPCGSLTFEIEGAHHRNVWPGPQPFNCPALGYAQLQPNETKVGSGTWGQTQPSGTTRVPVGNYTLVVGGHFSFPLRVEKH